MNTSLSLFLIFRFNFKTKQMSILYLFLFLIFKYKCICDMNAHIRSRVRRMLRYGRDKKTAETPTGRPTRVYIAHTHKYTCS